MTDPKELLSRLEALAKEYEVTEEPAKLRAIEGKLLDLLVDSMPEGLKAAGAVTDRAKLREIHDVSFKIALRFAHQLFFLMVTKPDQTHECHMVIPPLGTTPERAQEIVRAVTEANPGATVAVTQVPVGEVGEKIVDREPVKAPSGMPAFAQGKAKA